MTGGTLNCGTITIGSGSASGGSTFNFSGGTINCTSYLNVGRNFYANGDAGILNIDGGSITTPWLRMYDSAVGIVNLKAGTLNVTSTMDPGSEDMINITQGKLVWTGDHRTAVNGFISAGIIKGYGNNGTVIVTYTGGKTEITASGYYNTACISWGDVIVTYGADTDSAFDSAQGIKNMIQRLKGRGYTGIALRTDIAEIDDPNLNTWNNGILPSTGMIANVTKEVTQNLDVLKFANEAAQVNGFEFWAWVPTVYSRGAPADFDNCTFAWSHQDTAVCENNDLLTVDRGRTKRQYGISEFTYNDARSSKVDEFEYYARKYGVRNFVASMRSEAAQNQSPPQWADEFGFSQSVVDAMSSLYGINILTDYRFAGSAPSFQYTNDQYVNYWRSLRGSYLTQFFTDLRARMNDFDPGIRIGTELPGGDYVGPPIGNIKADWRSWINNGLIQELVLGITLCGTGTSNEDPDAGSKGYLTCLEANQGQLGVSTFRNYINSSNYPNTRLNYGGGTWPFFSAPPSGTNGWRTNNAIFQDGYCLAWYQRWQQWNADVNEFGYIKFIDQNFDSLPTATKGYADSGAVGDYRYKLYTDANHTTLLRACPGLWSEIGDGTDNKATVQTAVKYGATGKALKLTRSNGGTTPVYARHLGMIDSSNWVMGIDNKIANGTCTLSCQINRDTADTYLTISPDYQETNVSLYVGANGGLVYYRQNGSWVSSGLSSTLDTWEKYTIIIDLENRTYSAYKNDTSVICTNISYTPLNGNTFCMSLFAPMGVSGTVLYLDDVSLRWTPKTVIAPKGQNTFLADSFESHPIRGLLNGRSPDIGSSWSLAVGGDTNSFYIENQVSFGNGYKCMAAKRITPSKITSSNTLQLDPNYNVMVDFDLYITSTSSVTASVAKSVSSNHAAAVYVINDGRVCYWNGTGWSATGYTHGNNTWLHCQLVLDCSNRKYSIVLQPLGELPRVYGPYNWDPGTTAADSIMFIINPQAGTSFFDNVVVSYAAKAKNPSPANGATGVSVTPTLTWTAGTGTTSHNVYLGTSQARVASATRFSDEYKGNCVSPSFSAGTLLNGATYYWRVDEIGSNGIAKGNVWSFTVL